MSWVALAKAQFANSQAEVASQSIQKALGMPVYPSHSLP